MVIRNLLSLLCVLSFGCASAGEPHQGPRQVYVAAASDLTGAFEAVGRAFEAKTKQQMVFSFGSTGLLAKQLEEGAPFDVFAAANRSYVNDVVAAGACDGKTQAAYGRGRLALWSASRAFKSTGTLTQLLDPAFARIAIASPEHAPYGKAAKQALEKLGLWQALKSRVVYGENVRQALQFAQSGNAEVALVALSLVLGSNDGHYVVVDEVLHAPIEQTLVACKNGKNADGGRAFAKFVNSQEGRTLMRRYGFVLPGETLVQTP